MGVGLDLEPPQLKEVQPSFSGTSLFSQHFVSELKDWTSSSFAKILAPWSWEGEVGAGSDGERECFALASKIALPRIGGRQSYLWPARVWQSAKHWDAKTRQVIFRSIECQYFLQNIWTSLIKLLEQLQLAQLSRHSRHSKHIKPRTIPPISGSWDASASNKWYYGWILQATSMLVLNK